MYRNEQRLLLVVLSLLCLAGGACGKDESTSTSSPSGGGGLGQSSDDGMTPEQRAAEIEKTRGILEDIKADDTDIVFYGIVRDQDRIPVEGVTIEIGYRCSDEKIGLGSGDVAVKSDKNGEFAVRGIRGSQLFVRQMEKTAYKYDHSMNKTMFEYRQYIPDRFIPDEKNPEGFVLRKKNPPTLVIPSELRMDLQYGKTYCYNIASAKYWEEGQKPSGMQDLPSDFKIVAEGIDPYRFGFRKVKLTVYPHASGVVIAGKAYTAPEAGYAENHVVGYITGSSGPDYWMYAYIKQGYPTYSRWEFSASPSPESVTLLVKSLTNPSGERNLEYDEAIYREYLKKQKEGDKK